MKADAGFVRYSETQWRAIEAEAVRFSGTLDREELERLGRQCTTAASANQTLSQRRDNLDAERKQVEAFRRLAAEAGEWPLSLQKQVSDALTEIEQHHKSRADAIYWECEAAEMRVESLQATGNDLRIRHAIRPQNARLKHLDDYFALLLDVWIRMGGNWWPGINTKPLRAFIQVCARPVIGEKPSSDRAIAARLDRFDISHRAGFAYTNER